MNATTASPRMRNVISIGVTLVTVAGATRRRSD
jgi:hypothetical protein